MRIATHFLALASALVLMTALFGADNEASIPLLDSDGSPKSNEITIVGERLNFSPTSATVTAGEPITIRFKNEGRMSHNIGILEQGAGFEGVPRGDRSFITLSETLQGGKETELTLTIDEPGEYTFICNLAGHAAGGMVGTLVVEDE